MATSSTIQINISLYMFLAQFLLKKKIFLERFGFYFFPRNGVTWMSVNSTTRPKPLKKPSQTCTGINLVPRDDVLDNEAIIRIFAIHTGNLLPSIVGAVSFIVVNIYTCVGRRGVFCYLQHNFCTEMRVSNR